MYKHYIEQLESFNKKEPPVRRFQPQMQGTELEQLWANLSRGESKSLLKKHLTPERYKLLKDKKTKLGGTLADCIRSGKLYYVQLYMHVQARAFPQVKSSVPKITGVLY